MTPAELAEKLEARAKQCEANLEVCAENGYEAEEAHLQEEAKDLRQAAARLRSMEAEIARLTTPEWFNYWDDPEYSFDSYESAAYEAGPEAVIRLTGSREVYNGWVATFCVSVDDEGEPDETDVRKFKTEAEAARCWPESLAAARAALQGEGQ